MRFTILFALFAVVGTAGASAQVNNNPATTWTDSTRDVYIDNELDRGAQVLTSDSPSRLALLSSKFQFAVVLDVSAHTVSATSKDPFQFGADRTSATSDSSAEIKALGKFTR